MHLYDMSTYHELIQHRMIQHTSNAQGLRDAADAPGPTWAKIRSVRAVERLGGSSSSSSSSSISSSSSSSSSGNIMILLIIIMIIIIIIIIIREVANPTLYWYSMVQYGLVRSSMVWCGLVLRGGELIGSEIASKPNRALSARSSACEVANPTFPIELFE